MGTRGTLRIYVNGELKVRQYNQWDSYPTGQFKDICEAMSSAVVVTGMTTRLLRTRFATEEEWKNVCEGKPSGIESEFDVPQEQIDRWLLNLCDRDIGQDIIYLIAGQPQALKLIPDWWVVVKDSVWWPNSKEDLEDQEGNYVINIECDVKDKDFSPRQANIRVKLSGDWRGVRRDFDWGYIPTDEELDKWEKEGRGE